MGMYRKYHNLIEKWLFPALLLLYPFFAVNQGLDVADSTYSLTNFQYFDSMDGTWMVATFLSNAAGWLLMHLPFGGTLLGMKCYTTLVQSATALIVYFGLKKRIAAPLLFIGEFLALGLCWCPSTILYNYLTYLLMTAAVLLLFRGLTAGMLFEGVLSKGQGTSAGRGTGGSVLGTKQRLCFVAAGVCLGQYSGADAECGAGGIYRGGVVWDCVDTQAERREDCGRSGGKSRRIYRQNVAAVAGAYGCYRVVSARLRCRFWDAFGGHLCAVRCIRLSGYGADHVRHDGAGG